MGKGGLKRPPPAEKAKPIEQGRRRKTLVVGALGGVRNVKCDGVPTVLVCGGAAAARDGGDRFMALKVTPHARLGCFCRPLILVVGVRVRVRARDGDGYILVHGD